jgi:hypothetical protein
MTSNAHPYDPATVAGDRRPSDSHPRHYRAAIVATYHGPTDRRGAVWKASIKRSPNERAITAIAPFQEGPDAAVAALITKAGLTWRVLPSAGSVDGGNTYTYVAELTPGEGQALVAGERAVLALEAAKELEALTAGFVADPENPYGLALALARMATGTDRPRPLITGWAATRAGLEVRDHLGRTVFTLPDTYSAAHALACARAAGWQLSATARATADRLPITGLSEPSPDGVAIALAALGGCPAVIATPKGAH